MKFFIKKFSYSYIFIPLVVLGVALLGHYFTFLGMEWYSTLSLPSFTPPGWLISIIWIFIFILSSLSAILFWNASEYDKKFGIIIALFLDNAILNVLWSWLFFVKHMIFLSIVDMILLWIITILLIIAIWPRSKWASYLLFPYAIWLLIALYFAVQIYLLNK